MRAHQLWDIFICSFLSSCCEATREEQMTLINTRDWHLIQNHWKNKRVVIYPASHTNLTAVQHRRFRDTPCCTAGYSDTAILRADVYSVALGRNAVKKPTESTQQFFKPSHYLQCFCFSFTGVQRRPPELAEDSPSSDKRLLGEDNVHFSQDDPPVEFKSYKRRFYILLLFSVISFSQYCAWNTYGPIATTAKMVFDWTNTEIAFLASMDPITYLCSMFFFSWMMDVKGNVQCI